MSSEVKLPDYTPGELDRSAPARIWLQIDTGGSNDDRDEPWPGPDHVTWQDESIGGLEIEYVRADLALPSAGAEAVAWERKHDHGNWHSIGKDVFDLAQNNPALRRGYTFRALYTAPQADARDAVVDEAMVERACKAQFGVAWGAVTNNPHNNSILRDNVRAGLIAAITGRQQ